MNQKEIWASQSEELKDLFYKPEALDSLYKYIKKTDRILDQGCGTGRYSFTLYKLGYENIVGMDFSPKLLEIAKENAKKLNYEIKFVEGDIRNMPFKDGSFDVVISAGVIEHVPETEKAMSEISRVLKDEGYLFIHVPHRISTFTIIKLIRKSFGLWSLGYEKSFTKSEVRNLLKENGFIVLDFYINEFTAGKHKILGNIIRIIDKPLYLIGYGGHHLHFICKKENKANWK